MKHYKTIRKNSIAYKTLTRMLHRHEALKNSYFFNPPGAASSRRAEERKNSESFEFTLRGVVYKIIQEVSCSCKNYYYSLAVYVDGKQKDVRAIKKLVKGEN